MPYMMNLLITTPKTTKNYREESTGSHFGTLLRSISGILKSKFDGDLGVLERKQVIVDEVRHIGKESDPLNEPFGLDEYSYEFYDDPDRVNRKFTENFERILDLKPKDVKDIGINRTTLHNVKGKIKENEYDKITDKIKIKILSVLKNN